MDPTHRSSCFLPFNHSPLHPLRIVYSLYIRNSLLLSPCARKIIRCSAWTPLDLFVANGKWRPISRDLIYCMGVFWDWLYYVCAASWVEVHEKLTKRTSETHMEKGKEKKWVPIARHDTASIAHLKYPLLGLDVTYEKLKFTPLSIHHPLSIHVCLTFLPSHRMWKPDWPHTTSRRCVPSFLFLYTKRRTYRQIDHHFWLID